MFGGHHLWAWLSFAARAACTLSAHSLRPNHFVYLICDGEGTELIMCPDFYAAVLCGLHFGSQWHLRRVTLLAVQARL